jgi:hypothetical protein
MRKLLNLLKERGFSRALYFYKELLVLYKDLFVLFSIDRRLSSTRRPRYRLAKHYDRPKKIVK